ncbi:MAG: hypothetical protein BMS9Abin13_633 [Patescibacteria group bacterium]|nr:MAG: hypothetical protein BMS9Abin13_633 [Patescibacteria group bacterium]
MRGDRVTGVFYLGLFRQKLGFLLSLLIFFSIPVSVAHAGIFSFFGGLFDKTQQTIEKPYVNSQTASLLQAALNFDPNPSKGGGDITTTDGAILPDTGPSGTIADLEESPKSSQISVYVVQEGDTLSQIAQMFDVSVSTIIWANDIGGSRIIREGQVLVILPVSGLEYTVREGDTAASIAKKYKTNAQEILKFNDIPDESKLVVGDTIILPGGKKALPAYRKSSGNVVRSGYYIRPVKGGRRSQGPHGYEYSAVDLAVPYWTPIVASASGRVKISRGCYNNKSIRCNGGYGVYIVIEHDNGTQTLYSHNIKNRVKRGWSVLQGEVIGYVGSSGRSTGPHVHFEIRGARNPF